MQKIELMDVLDAGRAVHPHSETEYSPFDFEDRVVAAAKAGFAGIGLKEVDLSTYCSAEALGR